MCAGFNGLASALHVFECLCSCELWGVVCSMGGLDCGMDYWEHPSYSSFGEGGAGAGLQPLEGSYLRSLVAAPGSEAALVSCPPFVPSPCSTVDPHQSHLGYSCLLLILLSSPSNSL